MAVLDAAMAAVTPGQAARVPAVRALPQIGRVEPATVVDHRRHHEAGGDPYPAARSARESVRRCHNTKTRCEQLGRGLMRERLRRFWLAARSGPPWNRERKT